jgi:hypothetical protein
MLDGEIELIGRCGPMRQNFKDLLGTEGVLGLILFSLEGEVLYKSDPATTPLGGAVDKVALELVRTLTVAVQEADMIFSQQRVYLRQTPAGPLLVFLTSIASIAMVRLHCDTLVPSLKPPGRTGGLKRFFGKWR